MVKRRVAPVEGSRDSPFLALPTFIVRSKFACQRGYQYPGIIWYLFASLSRRRISVSRAVFLDLQVVYWKCQIHQSQKQ